MPLPERARFCPRCGTALPPRADATCPSDGYRWYPDPKVAVGVLVSEQPPSSHGSPRLLLVRRNHEPAMGQWAFPSGYVDAGEVLEAAAAREVAEETGVEVGLDGLLGAWSEAGNPVVFLAYAGHLLAGTPAPGDEASEVGWFDVSALPALAFDHDGEVVARYLEWRERRVQPGRTP